jgi:hypothetical protein
MAPLSDPSYYPRIYYPALKWRKSHRILIRPSRHRDRPHSSDANRVVRQVNHIYPKVGKVPTQQKGTQGAGSHHQWAFLLDTLVKNTSRLHF